MTETEDILAETIAAVLLVGSGYQDETNKRYGAGNGFTIEEARAALRQAIRQVADALDESP